MSQPPSWTPDTTYLIQQVVEMFSPMSWTRTTHAWTTWMGTVLTLLLSFIPTISAALNLTIDLDYAIYRGVETRVSSSGQGQGLITWKGIRYAAPPVSKLRWQPPQLPSINRTVVVANTFGPKCPQAMPAIPGLPFVRGEEDCLFLNVFVPSSANSSSPSSTGNANAGLLPVLVVIHGGGYGLGDATMDMSAFVAANGNSLVVVTIQYRVCMPFPVFTFNSILGQQVGVWSGLVWSHKRSVLTTVNMNK